jgi:tetratricopeptide (TPR) repeat protein
MKAVVGKAILAGIAGGLFLFSCAPPPPGSRPDTEYARQRLAAEDFSAALSSYEELVQSYPGDRTVAREFKESVEKIKARADGWFEEKDFAAAEKTYSLLLENFTSFSGFEHSLSFDRDSVSLRIRECQERLSERRAREFLAAGDYQKALDGFKVLSPDVLRTPHQSASLRRIMEETKGLADKALARKDYVAAGKGYAVLYQGYPLAQQADVSLSFSHSEAEEGLKECRTELTREGLEQYRKGKLEEAIAIWRGLLQFDPENVEVQKAVDTASEQLKRLSKK